MILEQLLKLLTDSSSDPEGQLRILARHTQESLDASFVELRMDGMPVIRLGDGAADARRYPISSGNRTVGELTLAPVPEDDPDQLAAIVRCAEVIYRLRAGYVDTLTGLYNRRRLDMEMEALALSDEPVTIAMLDIDHFKHVNDTHGHPAGDAVLKQFSARLAACLPAGGFLARYGGEEFCVILREVDEPAGVETVERMRHAVSLEPVRAEKREIQITSSAGVAFGSARQARELLGMADQALYAAKTGGRNQSVRSADLSRRRATQLFRKRFRRLLDRPLLDLAWFGQRVIGLDRNTDRLSCVDYFGGVVPVSRPFRGALSFARLGKKTFWVPADERGVRVAEGGAVLRGALDLSELRRVYIDQRASRLYLIDRAGRTLYASDPQLRRTRTIVFPDEAASKTRSLTAVLAAGRGLLVLDALTRRIFVFDRQSLSYRKSWTLPAAGYEICLCYLTTLKLLLVSGADGARLFSPDGSLVEETDLPVISAYDHPLVGLVLSTPDETVLVRS